MSEEQDEIAKLLAEYQKQKSNKENFDVLNEPLAPPVRRENVIDFAKPIENPADNTKKQEPKIKKAKKEKAPKPVKKAKEPKEPKIKVEKPQPTPEEIAFKKEQKELAKAKAKEKRQKALASVKKLVFNKKVLAIVLAIIVVVAGAFTIPAIVQSSKDSYLKPYEKKYNVSFPSGMIESYCDYYGENQSTTGFLTISDTDLATPVYTKNSGIYPMTEDVTDGATQSNFVVYLNDNSLENIYSTVEGYNNSTEEIYYSDLFNEYSFRVVGAFYTNTKAEDDKGYIFPYNTTEKMTEDSARNFADRISNRLLYDPGITLTRNDRYIFISCPTSFYADFRFVVVGVMRDNLSTKLTATEKSKIHYPQVIYDSKNEENPYRLSNAWYPEITITNDNESTTTIAKTIEDYKN